MEIKPGWRLLAPSSYTLTGIGAAVGDGASSGWSLTSAHHSVLGALSTGSIDPATVAVGDTLTLEYTPEAVTATQPWFCVLDTEQAPAATHRRGPRTEPDTDPAPIRFALHPSRPNPSQGPSLIRFDLPQATDLKLEIFDVHGRRIYELARGRFHAGHHAIEWSGRNGKGMRVSPGVYTCRLESERHLAQVKVVIVP
jgi:hypothetical protein